MADDEKAVIKELLDADADGKLSFEDAKAIAAKMAASARKRLVTLLDEDGDGEISWDEIQGGARGAFHRCEEALTRAWRVLAPHKTKLLAGAGIISCFHGANFSAGPVFITSFWGRVGGRRDPRHRRDGSQRVNTVLLTQSIRSSSRALSLRRRGRASSQHSQH